MKRERRSARNNQQVSNLEFSISYFHLVWHIFGLILATALPFVLIMSELTNHLSAHSHHKAHMSQIEMIVIYVLLLFFVSSIFITTILMVRKIKISPQSIEVNTLLWRHKLAKGDIKSFKSPPNLTFAWLKTKYVVYLLTKKEFKDWARLETALQEYLSNH
jgi:uncharacterized membrane protein